MLLWALECMYIFVWMFLFLFLWIYIQEWNCRIISLFYFFFFEKSPLCFPQWLHQFTFPPTVYKVSLFFTSWPTFVICKVSMTAILIGVRWQLFTALICNSLLMSNVKHFSCACWPSTFPLWKNVYTVSCQFFNWVIF